MIVPNYVCPEQFGALGGGLVDCGPAFRLAMAYCKANGIGEIRVKGVYRINALPRTTTLATFPTLWATDGHPLVVDGQHIKFTGPMMNPAVLKFYNVNGESFGGTTPGVNFQVVAGEVFRGFGFYLPTSNDPAYSSGIHLDGVILDGGTTPTTNVTYPANPADGTGWDLWHKAIGVEPDKPYGGDITLENYELIGWQGETIFAGNSGKKLYSRNGKLKNSNGSGLNANYSAVDVDGLIVENCNVAIEGWTGAAGGRIVNFTAINCKGDSSIQGGRQGAPTFNATRTIDGYLPVGEIDMTFIACGPIAMGSWLKGRVALVDTRMTIGAPGTFPSGAQNLDLDVTCTTDALAGVSHVQANGGSSGKKIDNINLRVRMLRTAAAIAVGRKADCPVAYSGSLGPNVRISVDGLDHCANMPRATGVVNDFAPLFTGDLYYNGSNTDNFQNVETSPTITLTGPVCALATTNAGTFNAVLPTANIQRGKEITLRNINGGTGGKIRFFADWTASKLNAGSDAYLNPGCSLKVKFNGSCWEPVGNIWHTA